MNISVTKEMLATLKLKVFGLNVLTHNILYHYRIKHEANFVIFASHEHHQELHRLTKSLSKIVSIELVEGASITMIPATRLSINDASFIEINSAEDIKIYRQKFTRQILENTQTPIARYVNKPLSIPVSRLLARFKISPNFISFVALAVSMLGAFLTISNPLGVLGYLCFHINSLLDGCDGEVARMNYAFSDFGKKLDVFGDYFTTVLILVSVAFGFKTGAGWVSLAFFALTIFLWASATLLKLTPKNLAEIESQCHQKLANPKSVWEKVLGAMLFISRRDFYILSLFIAAVAGLAGLIPLWLALLSFTWLSLSLYTLNYLVKSLPKPRV